MLNLVMHGFPLHWSRPLNHLSRYTIGKVIGAGSFGVVREAVHRKTGVHYACKTIPKMPKKGRGTPRYLLKIQTEVDAMLQLGPSLDAVFLNVSTMHYARTSLYTLCFMVFSKGVPDKH